MDRPDVTSLLDQARAGAPDATSRLLEAVYRELRDMAAAKMSRERASHTLQPTALVHEAFMRLTGDRGSLEDRSRFFAAAAIAMERVLIDHARARAAGKRGGGAERLTLDALAGAIADEGFDVLELHELLAQLDRESEDLSTLVRYRAFLGMRLEEVAPLMGISLTTAQRRWTFARAWLHDRLGGGPG